MKKWMFVIVLFSLVSLQYAEEREEKAAIDKNIDLPIEEKMALLFDHYKDGSSYNDAGNFAGSCVEEFGVDVIPYLKEYTEKADFLHFVKEPKDITLQLVGVTFFWLHFYNALEDSFLGKMTDTNVAFSESDIQWFVTKYKQKIDEYIRVNQKIDVVVLNAEFYLIPSIVGYHRNHVDGKWVGGYELEKYGHRDFVKNVDEFRNQGAQAFVDVEAMQKYYQERLGIEYLPIEIDQIKEDEREEKTVIDENIDLPVEEKMKLFFEHYKDGSSYDDAESFVGVCVKDFGVDVIPYLKEYTEEANFLHFTKEPKDTTLQLVSTTFFWIHLYNVIHDSPLGKIGESIVADYEPLESDIQWFVTKYKQKLDEYIRVNKKIDDVVINAENFLIPTIVGYYRNYDDGKWVGGYELEKYGHRDFITREDSPNNIGSKYILDVEAVQKYYQERLGIEYLPIVTED